MDEAQMKIRMQVIACENEARSCQTEALEERNIAKLELKKGKRSLATLHAQNCIKLENRSKLLLQSASTMNGFLADMEASKNIENVARAMKTTTDEMKEAVNQKNIQQIAENKNKYDESKVKVQTADYLLNNGEDQMEVNVMTDDMMSQIDDEILGNANLNVMIPSQQVSVARKDAFKSNDETSEQKQKITVPINL